MDATTNPWSYHQPDQSIPRKENGDLTAGVLQNMIRERRTTRTGRIKLENREVQTSPVVNSRRREASGNGSRQASISSARPGLQKEMGLREMQEHITRIDKQNFDLKLEVFHRKQRNEVLEKKLADMEGLETSYEELQASHDALLLKFDQHQLVLDDAVAQICDLEVENEELQMALGRQGLGTMRSSSSELVHQHASNPQQHQVCTVASVRGDGSGHSNGDLQAFKRPSDSECFSTGKTEPLDMYSMEPNAAKIRRPNASLLSLDQSESLLSNGSEDDQEQLDQLLLQSHRLSILSESGFSSIYGSPRDLARTPSPQDGHSPRDLSSQNPPAGSSPRKISVEGRDNGVMQNNARPSTLRNQQKSSANNSDRYSSIGYMLEKIPSAPSCRLQGSASQAGQLSSPSKVNDERFENFSPERRTKKLAQSNASSTNSPSNYVGGMLPPTPETMSTATVGGGSSTQSVITEKSLYDQGHRGGRAFASLALNYGRPSTSESMTSRGSVSQDGVSANAALTQYDDEVHSTQGEKSETDLGSCALDENRAFPFLGGQSHPDGVIGASRRRRPPLIPQSASMFNKDGSAITEQTRAFSYHLSRPPQKTPPVSPTHQRTPAPKPTGMPSKRIPHDDLNLSPKKHYHGSGISQTSSTQRTARNPFALLRRNKSQNANTIPASEDINSPAQTHAVRSNSLSRPQKQTPDPTAGKSGKSQPQSYASRLRGKMLARTGSLSSLANFRL